MEEILYIECEYPKEWPHERVMKVREFIETNYKTKNLSFYPAERILFYVATDSFSAEEEIETFVRGLKQ